MNKIRSTYRREEGGVANVRIPPRVGHVAIVGLEENNEEVPLQELPVPQELQVLEVSPIP